MHPDKKVVCVQGDSAFGFAGMECEVAVRHKLPITWVILNNNGIGGARPELFEHEHLPPGGLNPGTRYDLVMEGLGGKGYHCESAEQVRALIARENERGIPTERIVLAGFSQGGAVALHVGLRHEERFAGLMALSTYLVLADTVESERGKANRGISIFQAHGC